MCLPIQRGDRAPCRARPECVLWEQGSPGAQGGARASSPAQPSSPRAVRSLGCGQTAGAAPFSRKDQEEKKPQHGAFEKRCRSSQTQLPLRASEGRRCPENGLWGSQKLVLETIRGAQEDQMKTMTKRVGEPRTGRGSRGVQKATGEERTRAVERTGGEGGRP